MRRLFPSRRGLSDPFHDLANYREIAVRSHNPNGVAWSDMLRNQEIHISVFSQPLDSHTITFPGRNHALHKLFAVSLRGVDDDGIAVIDNRGHGIPCNLYCVKFAATREP